MFKPPPPKDTNPQYVCASAECNNLATTIAPHEGQWYRTCGCRVVGLKPKSKALTAPLDANDMDFIGNQIFVIGSVPIQDNDSDHGITRYPEAAREFLQRLSDGGYVVTKAPKDI